MARTLVVLLILSVVLATTFQVARSQVGWDQYGKCLKECENSCQKGGHDSEYCERQCDDECMAKDSAARQSGQTR